MSGFRGLRTRSFQRATRYHSSLRTRPCATACHSPGSTGPAYGSRARVSRCRIGSRTRSRWGRVSSSRPRMCRPTVRCLCTAHCGRSSPPTHPGPARRRGRRRSSPPVPRAARSVNQPPPSKPGPLNRRPGRSPPVPGPRPRGAFHPRWTARSRPPRPRPAGCPPRRQPAGSHCLHVPPQGGRAHPAAQPGQAGGESGRARWRSGSAGARMKSMTRGSPWLS